MGISDWQAIAQFPEHLNLNLPELPSPLIDWDEAPDLDHFYGRIQPLNQLEEWITKDNCKLVAIVGMGGIGKTALTVALCDLAANSKGVRCLTLQGLEQAFCSYL
ncbi:hypothetical protein [Coleofasciculus sp.]|uniref:hypothetical protein n=1 Tax=Coleofasciculus sp. TaxID=3100458 RepID=UPI003A38F6CA